MSLSFLVLLAVKSTAVLAAALLVVAMFRGRPAADKAAILRCALFALLFLPVFDAVLPALPVEIAVLQPVSSGIEPEVSAGSGHVFNWVWSVAAIYAAGVVVGLVRFMRDIAVLNHWISQAMPATSPAWRRACAEANLPALRLLVSQRVDAPISFGWFKPVILIDRFSAARDDVARPILAHELAHIARRDWLLQMISTVAVILFWFNPLAWVAKRAADYFAEEAVDQIVLSQVSATNYAQVLLECAKPRRVVSAATGVAARGAPLKRRMHLILNGALISRPRMQPVVIATVSMLSVAALAAAQVVAPPVANAAAVRIMPAVTPAAFEAEEIVQSVAATSLHAAAAAPLVGAAPTPALFEAPQSFAETALSPAQFTSAPVEAPAETNTLPLTAEERQRERWMANMEQHDQRNNSRAENLKRQERALANRVWALEQIQQPRSAN